MVVRKLLKLFCPTACAACLVAGYALTENWMALVPIGLVWAAWLFAVNWPASLLLVASVALAASGLWLGASPFLMIPAAVLSLASWDVVRWNGFLTGDLSSEVEARLERAHYAWLGLTLGLGLLAALGGRLIQFPLPLGGLIVLVLLALLGLDRIWRLLKH
jgi:hypothetical protein